MAIDTSMFARLRGQRYIEKLDVTATQGNHPGDYIHPGQGIDAPYITDDLTFTSASWINMDSSTDGSNNGDGAMSFPVTADQDYSFSFIGAYASHDLATGLIIGFHHPGGNAKAMVEICTTGPATFDREWLTAVDTATGWTTVDAADTARFFRVEGLYQCDTDGTFTLRMQRGGDNHFLTILAGSGGTVAGF